MLSLMSISLDFGGLQVLRDVSLQVPEGTIFGLIGPNGAGKTSVFNLVTGLLRSSNGAIDFIGHRLDGMAPHRIIRLGIARTFQNIRLFKEMSVIENVLVAFSGHLTEELTRMLLPWRNHPANDRRDREAARLELARVGLIDKSEWPAGNLSYGEQRRLEIARALATGAKLLLLDEPAAGMNSAERHVLIEQILKLNQSGLTILIIEHDMGLIMNLCREIAVLNFGTVIALGSPDQIRRHPGVIEAYLGADDGFKPRPDSAV
jgi:branched-chain amino acid transport system ATP-binding protein